jgi:DNA-binding transcriptional LysR family regulator
MNVDQFRYITLQQLDALVCLVEERNFSLAAHKMRLTQPSLSKHIKNLEDFASCRLINRTKSGISLTSEGSILYGYAKRILRLRDEAHDKILLAKDTASGLIFTSASTIPATYFLPRVLTTLKRTYPSIRVHLSPGDSDSVIHMVIDGYAEIGFIGKPVNDKRLLSEPVWNDELILIACKGHPWEASGTVNVSDLSQESFISREKGSGTMSVFDEFLKSQHGTMLLNFQIVSEMGSTEAVKESVIAGLGVSVLSIHSVKRELGQGILVRIPLEGPAIKRSFYMIRRKQFTLLPQHLLFMDIAKTHHIDIA